MTHTGSFFVPIYNCTVTLYVGPDIKNKCAEYEEIHQDIDKVPEDKGTSRGVTYAPDDIDFLYILIDEKDFTVNIFNHERSHLVDELLESRDMQARDECRAYLEGFIAEQFELLFLKMKIRPELRTSGPSLADGGDLQSRMEKSSP